MTDGPQLPAGCDEHCVNFCRLRSNPQHIETIAAGPGIRARNLLNKRFGSARWRKLKATAEIELFDGSLRSAEIHWYEAQGIGRRMIKRKRLLD